MVLSTPMPDNTPSMTPEFREVLLRRTEVRAELDRRIRERFPAEGYDSFYSPSQWNDRKGRTLQEITDTLEGVHT